MDKRIIILLVLVSAIVLGIVFWPSSYAKAKEDIILYKDPNCGCCVSYADYLQKNGYKVKIIETSNMPKIKKKYNISKESCHTAILGNQIIEGHIPIDAVKKMEKDKSIKGIALPGMPAGSPGMPGTKRGPFTIYALKNKEWSEWMKE